MVLKVCVLVYLRQQVNDNYKDVCGKTQTSLGSMEMKAKKTGGFSEWPLSEWPLDDSQTR